MKDKFDPSARILSKEPLVERPASFKVPENARDNIVPFRGPSEADIKANSERLASLRNELSEKAIRVPPPETRAEVEPSVPQAAVQPEHGFSSAQEGFLKRIARRLSGR